MYSTNYSDLLRYSDDNCDEPNIMSGGAGPVTETKNETKTETKNNKIEAAPGSNDLENQDLKLLRQKSELSNINSFSDLFKLFSQDIIKQRFMENPKWITGINFI